MRAELEIAADLKMIISAFEVPPNTSLPRHYHPGEKFVHASEGSGSVGQKRGHVLGAARYARTPHPMHANDASKPGDGPWREANMPLFFTGSLQN
jgi:hypothetical protein